MHQFLFTEVGSTNPTSWSRTQNHRSFQLGSFKEFTFTVKNRTNFPYGYW